MFCKTYYLDSNMKNLLYFLESFDFSSEPKFELLYLGFEFPTHSIYNGAR